MRATYPPVLPFLAVIILAAGCAGIGQKAPPDEVKAFFVAANEANLLGVQCLSPNQVDLSGYTHLMGVKYPPTQEVDILDRPPSRPYQAFAVLESSAPYPSGTYDPGLLAGFKDKARAIGADAIILCHPGGREGLPGLGRSSKIEALAVRYRLENAADRSKNP
jgi:hypothetical protein